MRISILAIVAVIVAMFFVTAQARAMNEKDYQKEFTAFVKKYNKNYAHDEFFSRYNTFKGNFDIIRAHNMKNSSFSMGINKFADLTQAEFKAKYTGYNHRDQSFLKSKNAKHANGKLHKIQTPDSIDWVEKGAVTAVKDQGQCGSCWSFSTTGALEGLYFNKGNKLTAFSEQQLVDCSTAQGNQGCNGGLMDDAFQYYISNAKTPMCTEEEYAYSATGPNTCDTSKCGSVSGGFVTGFTDVTVGSESALMEAVSQGPVSIAIEADQSVFQYYTGGVMDATTCGTTLDHGVLVVGYGTDSATGKKFWKVKNSWGASWGESGYIRLVQGINQCGLTNSASYPTSK